jgi:predicted alpha/beta hydrolase family esterase
MTYLILHGSFGSPEENWFTWLKLKLEERGDKIYLPALPTDDFNNFKPSDQPKQSLNSWLEAIQLTIDEIIKKGEDLTIIAHSIAPSFVLSLMDANPRLKVKKLIVVAPFLHHGKASQM